MRRILQTLLTGLLLTGLATAAQPGGTDPPRQGRSRNGTYAITVRGFYTGTGTATVSPTSIQLAGTVYEPSGQSRQLDITVNVSGPYVSGTGNLGPGALMVVGRLDAARMSRLVCTYRGATVPGEPSGFRTGRIAGSLPTDVADEGWDEEQRPAE
jgi:hypothetical protein